MKISFAPTHEPLGARTQCMQPTIWRQPWWDDNHDDDAADVATTAAATTATTTADTTTADDDDFLLQDVCSFDSQYLFSPPVTDSSLFHFKPPDNTISYNTVQML